MRNFTIKQLLTFIEVAKLGSISKAADKLCVTQPAISMQLKALEEAFEIPLFYTAGRNIKLTKSGEVFLRNAINVVGEIRNLESDMEKHKSLDEGELELCVVSTAKYFMPMLLVKFRELHPKINIKMRIENRANTINILSRNETDLVIMGRVPIELDCIKQKFAPNPMAIIAPPNSLLASKKDLRLQDLANELFVVRELGSGTRNAMERVFSNAQIELRTSMEMPSNESLKQAVMAGMGLSFISLDTIGNELRAGLIKVLEVEGMPIVGNWFVTHLRQRKLSPAAEAFSDFIIKHGARLIEEWYR